MFEDATFHSSGILHDKTPKWMLLTLAINLSAVAALIVLPLLYPDTLPSRILRQTLFAPMPPLTRITPLHITSTQLASQQTQSIRNPFEAPRLIPNSISTAPDNTPPPTGDVSISSDSTPGGLGTQSALFQTTPKPVVRAAPAQKPRISDGVAQGMLLTRTAPLYPVIAKTAGISGTVSLAATISKSGTIENLRVLSGQPMLRQAALDAVQKWRYRPYLLSGQPIEVETTINVVFSLTH